MSEVQQIIVFRKSSQSFSRMYLFVELGKADSQGEVIRLQRLRNRLWKISSPISLWKVFFTLHDAQLVLVFNPVTVPLAFSIFCYVSGVVPANPFLPLCSYVGM